MKTAAFYDHYLEVPFDLSDVFFIATTNVLGRIPTALRNRLEVIEIAGYSQADKLEIAKRILVPARILDHGLTSDLIEFEDGTLRTMIRDHARQCPHPFTLRLAAANWCRSSRNRRQMRGHSSRYASVATSRLQRRSTTCNPCIQPRHDACGWKALWYSRRSSERQAQSNRCGFFDRCDSSMTPRSPRSGSGATRRRC